MAYKRINWTNTPSTPLNATNLNHMEEGIAAANDDLNDVAKNYDTFAAFPNQSANIMKNHKNFANTNGWQTADGNVTIARANTGNGMLRVQASGNSGIYGSLTKNIDVDDSRTILIKIRTRCTVGTTTTVRPVWRNTSNGTYLATDNIVASNLDNAADTISWTVGAEWRDLWLIAQNPTSKTINQIGIFIEAGKTILIEYFDVYYSADDVGTQIDNANTQLDSVTQRVSVTETDIVTLKNDNASNKKRLTAVENEIKTARGSSASLNTRISGISSTASAANTTANSAKTTADNLQTEIETARGGKTNLDARIDNIETATETNAQDITDTKSNYDVFAAFPNQSANIMQNHKNFVNADGWATVNDGTITAVDNVLQIASTNDYGIYGALTRGITVDTTKTVLIKIRAKCTAGATSVLKPVWRRNINGAYLTSANVVASNLDTLTGNVSWTVGAEWRDLWLIAQNAPVVVNQIGIIITGGTTIEIAHFDVYYSADGMDDVTNVIDDLQAYIGYQGTDDPDIVGLQVDYENRIFTRLAGAVGKTMGADFDVYPMYGGRRRCNVADDGTINAYYGDDNYADDGTNGQVMVYQPKFYYRVVPLKLDENTAGLGYHIRKANYYVSAVPKPGFKLHPAFYDENGNPIDYILYSAYEGSYWDDSMGAYFNDGTDTDTAIDTTNDRICSVAGVKPISGLHKNLTRTNAETLAKSRGAGWHIETIKSLSATQLLMMVEMGMMNSQTAIGRGVVNITNNADYNCSSLTGSTASIGNRTGQAAQTINEIAGVETQYTDNGKTAISYRGMENPWGNIGKHINGINLWGNGTMLGGEAYIAGDFNFDEQKNSENYQPSGIRIANGSGWINAMGYNNENFDWLMLPTDMGGTSVLPIGDYCYIAANNKLYRYPVSGGSYQSSGQGGLFYTLYSVTANSRLRTYNARLLYVPSATI